MVERTRVDVNLDRIDQPVETMSWLSTADALAMLQVQQQTLYAYVSRGRIRARQDPDDPRRSLYNRNDVERFAKRQAGRHSAATVASEAIAWGEPVLASSISTVSDGRLWYRGIDAVGWSQSASLEDTAAWLWQCAPLHFDLASHGVETSSPSLQRAMMALVLKSDIGTATPDPETSIQEGRRLLGLLATALLGEGDTQEQPLHEHMAKAWHVPAAADALRLALVLLADHELNASTFAARVAASTGASLGASLLAGLCTLSGPYHGAAALAAREWMKASGSKSSSGVIDARDVRFPAFGHPLYPAGDPRAVALMAALDMPAHVIDLQKQLEEHSGEAPNIDWALAALAETFGLSEQAPMVIFTLARSVGWIAHCLEQTQTGNLIRPRARYVGPDLRREEP